MSKTESQPRLQPDAPEHPTIKCGVSLVPEAGVRACSPGRPKETGNGYRRETWSLCLHRSGWCATPLKLEYDVQRVDDTLGHLLAICCGVMRITAKLTGM
jgi:hypothetical protein